MGVHCNIVTNDGYSFKLDYVCFGFMRHMDDLEDEWYGHTQLVDGKRKPMCDMDFTHQVNWSLPNIRYIDYTPSYARGFELKKAQKTSYANVVKDMLATFPIFDNLQYMPMAGKIRCTIKNQPADKIALGLMLCRNLTGVWRDSGVLNFAINRGYPTPVAILIDTLYQRYEDYRGDCTWNFDPGSEDCIFDPHTGGAKSISDFLNQPEGYNPWCQSVFNKDNLGYLRDSDYAEEGDIMNCSGVEPEYDDWDDITNHDELSETGETYFRKLISCFSTYYGAGDDCLEGWQCWDSDLQEFMINSKYRSGLKDRDVIKVLDMFNSLYKKDIK
jgi:hypothetical protein